MNKTLDRVILQPLVEDYDNATGEEFQDTLARISENLAEPKNAVNHVLQGQLEPALITTTRFVYNSTIGIGGSFDPASRLGLFSQPTNFNQTLASWDVPEGPYIEAPLLGPNTARSLIGEAVDYQIDPVRVFLNQSFGAEARRDYTYFQLLSTLNTRTRSGNLVDMILYQSTDSYLAARTAYLQNQRATLDAQEAKRSGEQVYESVELENFYEFE